MYVKKSKSNGRIYLSFVEGYRKDGKVKQRTIEKIGWLDELEKYYDNPVAHFRKIARERSNNTAVIPENAAIEDNTADENSGKYKVELIYIRCTKYQKGIRKYDKRRISLRNHRAAKERIP